MHELLDAVHEQLLSEVVLVFLLLQALVLRHHLLLQLNQLTNIGLIIPLVNILCQGIRGRRAGGFSRQRIRIRVVSFGKRIILLCGRIWRLLRCGLSNDAQCEDFVHLCIGQGSCGFLLYEIFRYSSF